MVVEWKSNILHGPTFIYHDELTSNHRGRRNQRYYLFCESDPQDPKMVKWLHPTDDSPVESEVITHEFYQFITAISTGHFEQYITRLSVSRFFLDSPKTAPHFNGLWKCAERESGGQVVHVGLYARVKGIYTAVISPYQYDFLFRVCQMRRGT